LLRFGNQYINYLSGHGHKVFWRIINQHTTINIRRLRFQPSLPKQIRFFRIAFKEYLQRLTNFRAVSTQGNPGRRFFAIFGSTLSGKS
jgi:hypothetical protein